jgi:hypothetical protein
LKNSRFDFKNNPANAVCSIIPFAHLHIYQMSIPTEEGNVSCGRSWSITFTQPQLPGIKVGQHRNLIHTIPSSVFRRETKQPKPAKMKFVSYLTLI